MRVMIYKLQIVVGGGGKDPSPHFKKILVIRVKIHHQTEK